ncbi:FeoA family protein [Tissierella sp. MB52-C2]|uniref:FeoA family protein n=1 Tax=Tissierella sp. MB52-C2 TaxID=3070999 RepID=UPI00280ABAE1|nr:FeoA family protein [Tissierella sp. MB52-C2]WMM24643.1 FeoA family protein [Tissierella sp. MB52-C2]
MVLTNCKKTYDYKIKDLPDLHLLKVLGLRKGIDFKVQSKQPLGGPIVVKVGNRSIAIAKDVAKEIVVQEVS